MVYSTTCAACGADLTKAGFYQCTFCRSYFCSRHRDPKDHNCPVLQPTKEEKKSFWEKVLSKKEESSTGMRKKQNSNHKKANHRR